MKKFLGITLVLLTAFVLAGCQQDVDAETGVTLLAVDINPSIEFVLDEDDIVVSFSFGNEDAEIAAADIDFIGLPFDEALELFLNAAMETGYIDIETNDNTVIITVGNENAAKEGELQENAEAAALGFLEQHRIGAAVMNGKLVYDELAQLAEEHDISIGKVRVIQALLATDETLTFDSFVDVPMNELMDQLEDAHQERVQAFVATKQEDAIALKQQLQSNYQGTLQQHQERVANEELPIPNFTAIKTANEGLLDQLMIQYQQKADEIRNDAIDEVDPTQYAPKNNNQNTD